MTIKSSLLTERDIMILEDLAKYRFLSPKQIQALYFSHSQLAYRRLDKLMKKGLINRFTADEVTSHIYHLDSKGFAILQNSNDLRSDEPVSINYIVPRNPLFLKHFLLINEFQIHLKLACQERSPDIIFRGFIPEYYGDGNGANRTDRYIQDEVVLENSKETITHIPDGVFALMRNQKVALFFVEIDCGTETISNPEKGLLRYLIFYARYLEQEKFKRYRKDFDAKELNKFRVLIVTSSLRRLKNIQRVISDFSPIDQIKDVIFLTVQELISTENIFDTIWFSTNPFDSCVYSVLGETAEMNHDLFDNN